MGSEKNSLPVNACSFLQGGGMSFPLFKDKDTKEKKIKDTREKKNQHQRKKIKRHC